MSKKLYEIVDLSEEDFYVPVGLFETARDAVNAILNFDDTRRINEDGIYPYEDLVVVERGIGIGGERRQVRHIKRIQYDDDDGVSRWVVKV